MKYLHAYEEAKRRVADELAAHKSNPTDETLCLLKDAIEQWLQAVERFK